MFAKIDLFTHFCKTPLKDRVVASYTDDSLRIYLLRKMRFNNTIYPGKDVIKPTCS